MIIMLVEKEQGIKSFGPRQILNKQVQLQSWIYKMILVNIGSYSYLLYKGLANVNNVRL
jgi:hypothetical protein